MKYLAIDIETTHIYPGCGQILEFAAIFEDTSNPLPLADIPKLEVIFNHNEIYGDPFAINMNSRLIEILADPAKCPENVNFIQGPSEPQIFVRIFKQFLRDQFGNDHEQIVVAGKNVEGFDLKWVRHNFPTLAEVFHRRTLDPGSMYCRPDDDVPPNLKECLKRAGLGGPTELHAALGDAWDAVRLIRNAWNVN